MNILTLENTSKTFGTQKAVDNVSFAVPTQSIFGLLGPNGAGKTTLLRMITNILAVDSGKILINAKLMKTHSSLIGYMPEERGLYKKMKVGEHLLYLARLKNLTKNKAKENLNYWFEKFDITEWLNKKVGELSKGMQQKIQFIATVVHEPKLIILDEPFSGLDPINTNLIKNEIKELRNNGASIIFSTHRMEQVEEICERIVLINEGINLLEGEVGNIKEQFKKNEYSVHFKGEIRELRSKNFSIITRNANELRIQVNEGFSSNELLQHLIKEGIEISSFMEILPSLNDIFIDQVTGKG